MERFLVNGSLPQQKSKMYHPDSENFKNKNTTHFINQYKLFIFHQIIIITNLARS